MSAHTKGLLRVGPEKVKAMYGGQSVGVYPADADAFTKANVVVVPMQRTPESLRAAVAYAAAYNGTDALTTLIAQRDELLAALQAIVSCWPQMGAGQANNHMADAMAAKARAAIAKVGAA